MYIDTHAHLNFKAFESDYAQALERAFEVGVKKIILVGSNLETSLKAVEIAKKYDGVFAAVGLHPIHVLDEIFSEDFEKLARHKKVVAIGETGLDYYHSNNRKDQQRELFLKHLNLARLLNKPVILHNRDAGEDVLSILTAQSPLPKGVMHCFAENWDYAQVILDMGFYLSFTGMITFTKNYATLEVARNVPLDRLMIETDSPYLTPAFAKAACLKAAGKPESHRGQRNEPAYIIEVVKKIAEIKKISVGVVADQTTQNAIDLFKLA